MSYLQTVASEYTFNAKTQMDKSKENDLSPKEGSSPRENSEDTWETSRSTISGLTSLQLVKAQKTEADLEKLFNIGTNVHNYNTEELNSTLELIDNENYYPNSPFTTNLKNIVKLRLDARQQLLLNFPATTALKETDQKDNFDNGKKIDVKLLDEWKKEYKAGSLNKFLPEGLLNTIPNLIDLEKSEEDRFGLYESLWERALQFTDGKDQRALVELRNEIRGNSNPALAALTDIYDGLSYRKRTSLFNYATDATSKAPIGTNDESTKEITDQYYLHNKDKGILTTMQSNGQRGDHTQLAMKILTSRINTDYYQDMSAEDVIASLEEEIYPDSYVVVTDSRYNVEVSKKAFKRLGLDPDEHAVKALNFLLYTFQDNSNSMQWQIKENLDPNLLQQISNNMDLEPGVILEKEIDNNNNSTGKIFKVTIDKNGNKVKKEVYADIQNRSLANLQEQVIEDVRTGESENLHSGFINQGDGVNLSVYLVSPITGKKNQGVLVGDFFRLGKDGKPVTKYITQKEIVTAAASANLLNYMLGAKFNATFNHANVRELYKNGSKQLEDGTLAPRISGIPFFRFLEKPGKLEFEGAITPLYNAMEAKAKELGVEELTHPQADKLLYNLLNKQNRWYKSKYIHNSLQKILSTFSNEYTGFK